MKDKYLLILSDSHRVPVISLPCRVYVIFDKVFFLSPLKLRFLVSILLLLIASLSSTLSAQENYMQQKVDYDMDLNYDDSTQVLSGTININYHHYGDHSLDTLFFHLWMNAFKDNSSPFAKDHLDIGRRDFYFADKEDRGYYESINISCDETPLRLNYQDVGEEIAYINLDKPIAPGATKSLQIDYKLKLPKNFSRTGYTDEALYLFYFYPKVAVYDAAGWHTFPYLNLGEFYSDFGDYNVKISLPSDYQLAHSGEIISHEGNTYSIKAEDVIDIGLVASKKYHHGMSKKQKSSDGLETNYRYFGDAKSLDGSKAVDYAISVSKYMDQHLAAVPYSDITIVPAAGLGGGMEYPGLITVSGDSDKQLEYYIAHEMIHQWFYSRIATNERAEPWLDEGITHYYTTRYFIDKYGEDYYTSLLPDFIAKELNGSIQQHLLANQSRRGAYDLSIGSSINYGLHAYVRPGQALAFLEHYLGRELFDKAMRNFYGEWNGSHPTTIDLKSSFAKVTGKKLDWFFDQLLVGDDNIEYCLHHHHDTSKGSELKISNKGIIKAPLEISYEDDSQDSENLWVEGFQGDTIIIIDNKKVKHATLDPLDKGLDINRNNDVSGGKTFKLSPITAFSDKEKRDLMYLPYYGFNEADKFWLGAAFYNSSLDFKPFKYLVAPAYGFGSGNLVGHAMLKYNQLKDEGPFEQIEYRLPLKSFSFAEGTVADYDLQYWKMDPSVRLYFDRKKANQTSYVELRYIHLIEEYPLFDVNGFGGLDRKQSGIYQLGYHKQSLSTLGSSFANLVLEYQQYTTLGIESEESYLKLTGDYKKSFFYSASKALSLRLFGAYFITNTRRESSQFGGDFSRGSIAMMHQGFNDYLYEDYFFDRVNQETGGGQISYAGGGFKNALGSTTRLGLSNDYALALNAEVDLPFKYLPFKIFADLGYYSTKSFTSQQLSGEFLYSAGLSIGSEVFSFYLPLFYSDEIDTQYQTQDIGVFNRISFMMNLNKATLWDKVDHLNF